MRLKQGLRAGRRNDPPATITSSAVLKSLTGLKGIGDSAVGRLILACRRKQMKGISFAIALEQ